MVEQISNQIKKHNFDIRQILTPIADIPNSELISNINKNAYSEKTIEINQLNLGLTKNLSEDITTIFDDDENDLIGVAFSCIASIQAQFGNFKKAIVGIYKALDIKVSDDVKAYIYTEYANLLRLLNKNDESISILNKALELTENENLKWFTTTYLGYATKDSSKALKFLNKSSDYYHKNGNQKKYIIILRHIGHVIANDLDFKRARRVLKKAKNIAEEHSLTSILIAVEIDLGWLLFMEEKYFEAEKKFLNILDNILDPYLLTNVYKNLGLIKCSTWKYDESINYYVKALEISQKHEYLEILFENYCQLGSSYEKIGNYKEAFRYYQEGYEKWMNEKNEQSILSYSGNRNTIINRYHNFLETHFSNTNVSELEKTFLFMKDFTYKKCTNIFKKNLLTIHLIRSRTIPELCVALQLSQRMYYIYKTRYDFDLVKNVKPPSINRHFINYLSSLTHLSWQSANKQFDKDLLSFYLKYYNYNKTKIASVLELSSPALFQKLHTMGLFQS